METTMVREWFEVARFGLVVAVGYMFVIPV